MASYVNDVLNQITSREVPGTNDITGLAHASATVAVNGQSVSRRGEYFRGTLATNNAGAVRYVAVTNRAVLGGLSSTNVGYLLVPGTPQSFSYDAYGNLLSDGVWANTWDGENRLIATETTVAVPAEGRARVTWSYQPDGRWRERVVYAWTNNQYVARATNRFVWDGQVLLAVLDHTNGLVQAYARGLDLSGSAQGAGGVGGVLWVVHRSTNTTQHFAAYDCNGNVSALVDAATGAESGRYEYGPFGETIRATGPMAKVNLLRFSTQYADEVTGTIKYLFREYQASTGRWVSRDPIDQANSYLFVGNNALSAFDILGLWGTDVHFHRTRSWGLDLGMPLLGAITIGDYDDKVDNDFSPYTFSDANWRWHFDRSGGGKDSRLRLSEIELRDAKAACTNPKDDWLSAAKHMGRSLHPLQDWVAHGDFNRRSEAPNIASVGLWEQPDYAHNTLTKQRGMGWASVDAPSLDSDGPDGRATFAVLKFARITSVKNRL